MCCQVPTNAQRNTSLLNFLLCYVVISIFKDQRREKSQSGVENLANFLMFLCNPKIFLGWN